MESKTAVNPALSASIPTEVNQELTAERVREAERETAVISEGTILCGQYVVESRMEVFAGEADLYLCVCEGKRYAAKVYRRRVAIKQEVIDALRKIDSPYVARALAVGEYSGYPVEILPYFENGSLQGRIYTEEELIASVIPQINEGLHALHEAGVIHKDLKPSNIMLADDGESVAIIDFGVSTTVDESVTVVVTESGMTPEYSAPETFRKLYYEGSDYYSFGVTLFELICGYTPYANMPPEEIEQYMALQRLPFPESMSDRMKKFISALTYYDISGRRDADNPNRRWTYEEVRRWLAGDETLAVPGERFTGPTGQKMPPFVFMGEAYDDREHLVQALAANWEEGKRQLFRGLITAHFRTFAPETARLCMEAEERAAAENGKDDVIYWRLLYQINPRLKGFCWKGRVYEGLPAFGRDVLERLWGSDFSMAQYYDSVLAERLLSQYVQLVAPGNEKFRKAAAAIEDAFALQKAEGTDVRRAYFLMAYTLSGQKLLSLDGQKFRTVGELAGYMKEKVERSRADFEKLCHRLIDRDGNLDFQMEAWLIAIGKQKELDLWRASMNA